MVGPLPWSSQTIVASVGASPPLAFPPALRAPGAVNVDEDIADNSADAGVVVDVNEDVEDSFDLKDSRPSSS